jgi:ubiquinone biosynthesis protein
MNRIRGTVWAIALWTVLLFLFWIPFTGEVLTACGDPVAIEAGCRTEIAIGISLIVIGLGWLIGTVVLLATNPRGILRALLVRVMVNTLALIITLSILSLIRLPSRGADGVVRDTPLLSVPDLLLVGLLFAVVNSIARPLLFAVFGRVILRTMGLAIVLINVVLFWFVAQLSQVLGEPWTTPDPRLLWLVIDALVFTVVLTVVDAFLGLDRPRVDRPTESRVWQFLERFPAQRRNALIESFRFNEVYNTISNYGLEIAIGGSVLAPIRRLGDRMTGRTSAEMEALSPPAKVRLMLQQLGPTFVKVGQMASSRADMLPEEWRTELDKLQNTVPPFPWEQAREIIASELNGDPEVLYASIEHEPLGAASLAQVHRATLHSGEQVVVKVQRPDVQAKVRADLGVMQEVAVIAETRLPAARKMDVSGLVKEFADGVLEELDYTVEAYHARRLADIVAPIEGVGVPKVYGELSTDRVLTMEFIPGVKATKSDQLDPSIDRERLARTFIRSVIKQVMIDGFFHGDPHPGNVMIDPTTGRITFLDLGLVGELAEDERFALIALLWALKTEDPGALANVALRLCTATGPFDQGAYESDIERLFYQYWVYGNASFSRMMSALFSTLQGHNLRMRKELTLAVKSITQAEELLRAIKPGMPLIETATSEAEQLLIGEITVRRARKLAMGQVAQAVQQAIVAVGDRRGELGPMLLAAVTGGRLRAIAETPGQADLSPVLERLDRLSDRVDHTGRRLTTTMAGTGLALGLSLTLAAVILNPAVSLDGTVLLTGALAAISLGSLGLVVVRGGRG